MFGDWMPFQLFQESILLNDSWRIGIAKKILHSENSKSKYELFLEWIEIYKLFVWILIRKIYPQRNINEIYKCAIS